MQRIIWELLTSFDSERERERELGKDMEDVVDIIEVSPNQNYNIFLLTANTE